VGASRGSIVVKVWYWPRGKGEIVVLLRVFEGKGPPRPVIDKE